MRRTCPSCQSAIHNDATRCPYCTSTIPPGTSGFDLIVSLIQLAAIVIGGVAGWMLLQWLWQKFVVLATWVWGVITWIWYVITWPFIMIWKLIVWICETVAGIFNFIIFIIDLPSVYINKLIGFSFEPNWWQTAISFIVEIGVVVWLVMFFDKYNNSNKN